ncbi:MAG: hypothetical protein HUU22_18770 [Phycisphaerae bacterium]|nr:hypothetical protein [Phycisphaerae bacterium]NUQ48061.1 hypothetical protein [Phycisphaerae bacterium]
MHLRYLLSAAVLSPALLLLAPGCTVVPLQRPEVPPQIVVIPPDAGTSPSGSTQPQSPGIDSPGVEEPPLVLPSLLDDTRDAPTGLPPDAPASQYQWCPTGSLAGQFYGAPASVVVSAQTMNQFLMYDSSGVQVGDSYLLMGGEIRAGGFAYVFDAEIEMPGGSGFGTLVSYDTGERVRIWIMLFERGFGMTVNAFESGYGIEGSAQFVFGCQ